MRDRDVLEFEAREKAYQARRAELRKMVIAVKRPQPENSIKCKCGMRMDYVSYHGGDFYLNYCSECGRIQRRTTLTTQCKFCGVHEQMDDGMMHEYGRGYGDFWMCPKCANDGTFDAYAEQVEERSHWSYWGAW